MYKVYIIKSRDYDRYYVGMTRDVSARLERHNRGANRSTKPYRPWGVVYVEGFTDKVGALKREKQIKSYKDGEAFKKLITGEFA